MKVLQWTEVGCVRIPRCGIRITVSNRGPVHLYETRPCFHQTASEECALSKCVSTVLISHLIRFLRQVESIACPLRQDEVVRLFIILIQGVGISDLINFGHPCVNRLKEVFPAFQTHGWHLWTQTQIVEINFLIRVLEEEIRVIRSTEESGVSTFADDITLLHRARKLHCREHRFIRRTVICDMRCGIRMVGWRRRIELP